MKRSVLITREAIDETQLVSGRNIPSEIGAVVYFSGVVRAAEGADTVTALDYECFEPMAVHQFHLLFDELEKRWPVQSVRVIHRIGPVAVGVASLWVEICAPHRGEAFAACQFLIDEMKRVVPIWKKPVWASAPSPPG